MDGGYYIGIDYAYDPRQNRNNTLKVSSFTFGNSKGTYIGYDYYTYLGGWYL